MLNCAEWRELVCFGRLGVNPSKWLHVFQVWMLRTLVWQCYILVASNLRHKDDSANLLDLRVFSWRDTVHVAGNLDTKVRNADESLQNILRQYISVTNLLQVIRIDIDMVGAQMHISC